MVTYLIDHISQSINSKGQQFYTTIITHFGLKRPLIIDFKDNSNFKIPLDQSRIAITGNFKEEIEPYRISLGEAYVDNIPEEEDWVTFFVNYFLANNVIISINVLNEIYVNVDHSQIYISCTISKDKKLLEKLEFGRYLPLEEHEHDYVRKSTSWTKGVFVNDENTNIQFMQSSWSGEDEERYTLEYTKVNTKKISDFLNIPFNKGWIEEDTAVGLDNYYKAKAIVNINGEMKYWTFDLLDIGEQDIPLITDLPLRRLFRFLYDSFLYSKQRHTTKSIVNSINESG
jgi:hypothetical protein